ncbi:Sec-independent protein translocase protein TatB [Actibacterium pelagium]|uniref:Sec-independent protein translocase protein TatB n=1 Tax=Actibacterium pelagium TaxID=2029103 RepID=A0A917AER0_9RHOB|nr:Sec-independent protein translocase protein TatB [Actibacterium pelagium]GGE46324.1 hypothetical protein GCM10011517_12520 [Actibacterium pelagium]
MFDLGWSELLVIGIVALIVIGPKDLPDLFRTLGKFTAKIRRMARDFQRAMEDAADDAGVKDVAKDLKSATNPKKMGLDAINKAADELTAWEPPETSDAPKTAEMTEERKEMAEKIRNATAKSALDRQVEESAAADVDNEEGYAPLKEPGKAKE